MDDEDEKPLPSLDQVLIAFQKSLALSARHARSEALRNTELLDGSRPVYAIDGLSVELKGAVSMGLPGHEDRLAVDLDAPEGERSTIKFNVSQLTTSALDKPLTTISEIGDKRGPDLGVSHIALRGEYGFSFPELSVGLRFTAPGGLVRRLRGGPDRAAVMPVKVNTTGSTRIKLALVAPPKSSTDDWRFRVRSDADTPVTFSVKNADAIELDVLVFKPRSSDEDKSADRLISTSNRVHISRQQLAVIEALQKAPERSQEVLMDAVEAVLGAVAGPVSAGVLRSLASEALEPNIDRLTSVDAVQGFIREQARRLDERRRQSGDES